MLGLVCFGISVGAFACFECNVAHRGFTFGSRGPWQGFSIEVASCLYV